MTASSAAVTVLNANEGITRVTVGLVATLDAHGLPSAGVFVPVEERHKLFNNLGDVVARLDDEARARAVYLSKSVVACAAGLFDAALSYLWDETVANLRTKVARFDLAYFYDSVVTDTTRRRTLNTADDLVKLEDWELINGCHKIGILGDLGKKHLDYIRDMRNHASAAHPNQNQITGLQLASWMDTCICEVFTREPDAPAIEVKKLLANIRTATLAADDVIPINASIASLPFELAETLLTACFGMFCDPDVAASTKNNISLLAMNIWARASEDARKSVGLRCAAFGVNGDVARAAAARLFLERVGGLGYLPNDTLAVEFERRVTALEAAHQGMNNFHNEPVHARALLAIVPDTGVIPDVVRQRYVKAVVLSKIGTGYGVSWGAEPSYDQMIAKMQEPEIAAFCRLVLDTTVQGRLLLDSCGTRFRELARESRTRTSSLHLHRALDLILASNGTQIALVGRSSEMRRALDALS
jgi:hypothetical protein